GILTNEILIHHQPFLAVARRSKSRLGQNLDLLGLQLHSLVSRHGLQKLIEDRSHRKDFLFTDTEHIVVIGGAGDDGTSGVVQIRGFVDDHGWVAWPGDDGALWAPKRGPAHSGPSGDA